MRTSVDGKTWTPWRALHIEAMPDETPAGETYASLVWAPRHGFAQYRASLPAAAGVTRVTPTFLNSLDGPTIEAATTLELAQPAVIDVAREDWQCDERLRFDRRGREIWPRMYVPVKKLVVHHTAGRNSYTAEEARAEVRATYTYHAGTLGWGDIGYSALIDRYGNSYEGRYTREWSGGREVFGEDVVAGHSSKHNYGSCGVACIGEFESTYTVDGDSEPDLSPPAPMITRLLDVLEYRARGREIDPQAVSHFLLSDNTWNDSLDNVSGHKDTFATACPGDLIYGLLAQIRSALSARLALPSAPELNGPDFASQSTGSLSYSWGAGDPDGTAYSYFLEGWYKAPSSENISYLRGFTTDRRPDWTAPATARAFSVSGLTDGHYTLHLRRHTPTGTSYQANKTVLIIGVPGGKGRPR